MASADTSQSIVRYVEETSWGSTPSSALTELRFTGESLKFNISTVQSEEIRDDRQITDLITTKQEAGGGINGEFSYQAYDAFLEGAMYNDWVDTNYSSTSISITTGNVINLPGGHGQTFYVGQSIKMDGWSTTADNGIFTVSAKTTNTLTTSETLTNDAGGESVTITSHVLVNSTTRKSYTIEKEFTDLTKFIAFTGMVLASMALSIQSQNKITCSFSFLGKLAATGTSTVGTGSPTAAPTAEIMNAGDNVGSITSSGSTVALIKSLTLDLNNNLRGKPEIGTIGNGEIGSGRCAVTGALSMYFADFALYTDYINSDSSSLSFRLNDTDSLGTYIINLPKIKFTKADIVAGGPDQDVMVDGGYHAVRDPTTGYTIIITRV